MKRDSASLCSLFALGLVSYLSVLVTISGKENLDEQIAFDVAGSQQPISFSSARGTLFTVHVWVSYKLL